ncbi:MAG: haloacid dehalogenase type II [Bacteroidetes bacterium]|nr:haloacid dehalogenase type II [Bacteroidota bacterium]
MFRKAFLSIYTLAAILCITKPGVAQSVHRHYKAVAFDYFVLFNANSVIPHAEKYFPGKGAEFTKLWRSKQFEYCYLRTITNRYEDFFKITEDALNYTLRAMKLDMTAEDKKELLNAYLSLDLWPDTKASLQKLKDAGIKIITIANFSPQMLRANADKAGIANMFDVLLSTDANHSYKPSAAAYQLGMKKLGFKKEEIVFAAFGSWDAYGAKCFGYPTYWVNRFSLPREELGIMPDSTSPDMEGLLKFVLGRNKKAGCAMRNLL